MKRRYVRVWGHLPQAPAGMWTSAGKSDYDANRWRRENDGSLSVLKDDLEVARWAPGTWATAELIEGEVPTAPDASARASA